MKNKDDHLHDNGNGIHHDESIVIVGGGIGGLACALALLKVGVKVVVLEKASALRTEGMSLTLWNNAFRVLDVLGVGEKIRSMHTNIERWKMLNASAKPLGELVVAECEGGPHDLRAVERKVLLETLARELPEGIIRFNSEVIGIKQSGTKTGGAKVELRDGTVYSAKAVIGFDGQNSIVGSWLGLENAQAIGQVAFRGMTTVPNGHKLEPTVNYFLGKGACSAFMPLNSTKVYWFLCINQSGSDAGTTSPEQVKEEVLQLSQKFQSPDLHSHINNTPLEHIWKGRIRYRLNKTTDHLVKGNVTVAGDACHPSTPNMGQGGCMALEDAIVLTQKLYRAMNPAPHTAGSHGPEATRTGAATTTTEEEEEDRIHKALVEFQKERHPRTSFITSWSYRIGQIVNSGWAFSNFLRDRFFVPQTLRKETFMLKALFDVGDLPRHS